FRPAGDDRAGSGAAGIAVRLHGAAGPGRAAAWRAFPAVAVSAARIAAPRRPRLRCRRVDDGRQPNARRLDPRIPGAVVLGAQPLAGLTMDEIEIADYDPRWPALYEAERERLLLSCFL